MSKSNVELPSSKEGSKEDKLQQLQKPQFEKPSFLKPEIEKIFSKKAQKEFNINQKMTPQEIDEIPQNITINLRYFKKFYDGLMNSINAYNEDTSTNTNLP
jgi:hypothetical protein